MVRVCPQVNLKYSWRVWFGQSLLPHQRQIIMNAWGGGASTMLKGFEETLAVYLCVEQAEALRILSVLIERVTCRMHPLEAGNLC